jgi:hypothetical protein
MRYVTLLAAAVLAGSVAAPARAEETEVSYNDGTRGLIQVTVTPDAGARDAAADLHAVTGECHYDIVEASSQTSTMKVAVAGTVVAGARVIVQRDGRPDPTGPLGTLLTCTARSGAGADHDLSRTALGPASAVAGVLDLPVDVLTICITANAVFSDGAYVPLERHCRESDPPVRTP